LHHFNPQSNVPAPGWRLGGCSLPTPGQSMRLVVRVVYCVVRMVSAQKAFNLRNLIILVVVRMPMRFVGSQWR